MSRMTYFCAGQLVFDVGLFVTLRQSLRAFFDEHPPELLKEGRKGLEKESLRIDPEGPLTRTPHPPALGAALTHPYVTTDYAEAMLELITPPFTDPEAVMGFLDDLHVLVHRHIGVGEERSILQRLPWRSPA